MINVVDNDSGQTIRDLNLNPASAPRTGEYINLNKACYIVVTRTYAFSELGNLDGIVLRVTRIDAQ